MSDELIIFDGDCGICTQAVRQARKMRNSRVYRFLPYQSFSDASLIEMGLTRERCRAAVQLVTNGNHAATGAFAVNRFLLGHPIWRVLIWGVYLIPIFLVVELLLYSLVARNRSRISRLLGLDVCRIDS